MEKLVCICCYWLGLVCAAIALVMRGANALGLAVGVTGGYMTFFKGGALFLLVTIAAANFAWFKTKNP